MTETHAALTSRGPAAAAIEFARNRRGVNMRPLARRAGLSTSYVSKLASGMQPSLLAFARLATVLNLSPLEVWSVIRAEAMQSSLGCPRCDGRGEVLLPGAINRPLDPPGLDEYACPLCRPWPEGFPGEMVNGRWLIPPYEPGETPQWHGDA